MTYQKLKTLALWTCAAGLLFFRCDNLLAAETNIEQRLLELEKENSLLQSQLRKQQELIDSLAGKVADIQEKAANEGTPEPPAATEGLNAGSDMESHPAFGNVHLSGEGGIAFFNTGSEGFAPHSEFRVDEARLFVEAPVWKEVYFYSEVDLATRENTDLNLELGELYLDCEDVSQLWGRDGQLNLRLGKFQIPFGEEYLTRYAADNPLISHSLSDVWGFDTGVELYGTAGRFSYVAAVQNGSGANGVQDFDGDKSVSARLGYDPTRWLHLSISGMRTGNLNVQKDKLSALWFGGGFFRSIGSPATTTFNANLAEFDAAVHWKSGHVSAFGGYARYDDNDPAANNRRNLYYYSVEGMQELYPKLYAAARFSQIIAADGYPIVGYGNFGDYFFNEMSTRLWRLSLGVGYQFSDRLVTKLEYSFERGSEQGGGSRNHEDFLGAETTFQF